MEINLRSPAIMEINKSRFCVFKNWLSCFAGGSRHLREEMFELFCGRFPPSPRGNVGEMFELFCGRFPPSPRGDVGEMFDALNVRPAPPFGGETEQNHALKIN